MPSFLIVPGPYNREFSSLYIWLKRALCPCNLLHLDSADKQAISCGRRGCVPCETVVLLSQAAARKVLSQMQVWRSVILVDRDPEKYVFLSSWLPFV
jgi:hypothetical protein